MVRPCYLVIDPEHSGSISTRKLLIESAKLNVITAYSAGEAIQTVVKFPAVDAVVCNVELRDMSVADFVDAIKQRTPRTPVIVVGSQEHGRPHAADYHIESFDPRRLLDTIQVLEADKVAAIERHEDSLREQAEQR